MENFKKVSIGTEAEHNDLCLRMLTLRISVADGGCEMAEYFPEQRELLMPLWECAYNDLAALLSAWTTDYTFTSERVDYEFGFPVTDSVCLLMRLFLQARMAEALTRVSHPELSAAYHKESHCNAGALLNLMARLEQG